jgi:glucokinase
MKQFTAIGVDVGGTKIAAGAVAFPEGIVQARRVIPTAPQRGGEVVLAEVERIVSELADEVAQIGHRVEGIGIGVCELVDQSGEIVSANTMAWTAGDVRRLGAIAPVAIEADVRAAARAEALFGAGRNSRVFLYVTIGTGISCCLVINREPFTGARGATGTMASGPLPWFTGDGPPEPLLTLEQIASGPALVSRFRVARGVADSAQEVLKAAANGNTSSIAVVRSAAEALGATVGMLVNVLDPERVVLGGGLGLAEGLFRDALVSSARRHIWWDGHRDLPIVSAATGLDAGLLGAAAVVWNQK